jgi:hypothetical protein
MTKDEALDLALEKINKAREKVAALCEGKERWTMSVPVRPDYDHDVVISSALLMAEEAIKQARALDKKAENARELGLDYEPVELETVYEAIIQWDKCGGKRSRRDLAWRIVALYTTPPAQPAPAPGYCKHCKQYSIEEPLPAALEQDVFWGVDWGKAGDKSCVSIIKRLPNGKIEVVAVEYEP